MDLGDVTAPRRTAGIGVRAVAVVLMLAAAILGSLTAAPTTRGDDSVVRAVLFYSPSCPHCHQVMTEDLPPIQARFGDRLVVLAVDVTRPVGGTLYQAAIARFEIPADRVGVPTLIVGDVVLVGSLEIPQLLPSLTEHLLDAGGSAWPAILGLDEVLPSPQPSAMPVPEAVVASPGAEDSAAPAVVGGLTSTAGSAVADVLERVGRDAVGNALAILVLAGLLLSLAWVAARVRRTHGRIAPGSPSSWIAWTSLAGLAVAAYLASVEVAGTSAVCGPVGSCNLVHASVYARLLGVPVGLLGMAAYAAVLGCWLVARRARGPTATVARYGLVGLAGAGTLFSAYLTFLEAFVIGATCAWCLLSALLMAATLLLAVASIWPRRLTTTSAP